MGRATAILGIWFAGFLLGFIAYLAYPGLKQVVFMLAPFLLGLDSQIIGGVVAGFAGSVVTLATVLVWAYSGSK